VESGTRTKMSICQKTNLEKGGGKESMLKKPPKKRFSKNFPHWHKYDRRGEGKGLCEASRGTPNKKRRIFLRTEDANRRKRPFQGWWGKEGSVAFVGRHNKNDPGGDLRG